MAMFNGLMYSAVSAGGAGVSGLSTADGGTAIADNAIIRGDGTTGIQGSGVTLSDGRTFEGTDITIGNISSNACTYYSADNRIGFYAGASNQVCGIKKNGASDWRFGFDPVASIVWVPSGNAYDTENADVGIKRSAAGVLKVTDGSSGDGSIRVAVGSGGAPGYSFDDDPDTGIYCSGPDQLSIALGGSEKYTYYTNGLQLASGVGLVGSGLSSNSVRGMLNPVEANTDGSGSPNVIVATESLYVYTNEGATAENYHTLPTAAAGLEFTFIVQDTDGIRITASTGDTIRPIAGTAASATGGFIRCATAGAFIRLQAINATEWIATGSAGVWTIDV